MPLLKMFRRKRALFLVIARTADQQNQPVAVSPVCASLVVVKSNINQASSDPGFQGNPEAAQGEDQGDGVFKMKFALSAHRMPTTARRSEQERLIVGNREGSLSNALLIWR
jgi:hypothetical protein